MEKKILRQSHLRQAILDIFKKNHKPLSAPLLQMELAKKGIEPNKTSVYRQLETLKSCDALTSVTLDSGQQFYELKQDHHHHFICRMCQKILDFVDPKLEKQLQALKQKFKRKGLQAIDHEINFFGLCQSCS